jgi:uncharacterized protein
MDALAIDILKKYLGDDTPLFNSVYDHSIRVAEKSNSISKKHPELSADTQFLTEASLLHDVGVVFTDAPDIFCYGKYPYICHGILGREILEKEGLYKHALVCERHIGTGLNKNEIIERNLPLPVRDMIPLSIEEKIICFSDLFFSKSKPDKEFTPEEVGVNLAKYGDEGVRIFKFWSDMFL